MAYDTELSDNLKHKFMCLSGQLSPENLAQDGELSTAQVKK